MKKTVARQHSMKRPGFQRCGCFALAAILVSGCVIRPQPLDDKATQKAVQSDLKAIFEQQEALTGPLTLNEAQARAVKYNLDSRLRLMEQALAQGQLDVAKFDMLPRMVANAGYVGRSNTEASSSESILTHSQSLEPSTSVDRTRRVADLSVAWNVLDFGVSYYTAQQAADRALIAQERRRKVVQNIVQQVSSAYWRAVAAQRLIAKIDPLLERVQKAQSDSAAIEKLQLRSPIEALNYQRTLLDTLGRLESQRKELLLAKTELAALISLSPDRDFELSIPPTDYVVPTLNVDMDKLEQLALSRRPELREEHYQTRVSALETRKAMLRMLPGIEFGGGSHYDSNSFIENANWADYSAKVTWNLLNLFSGPANIRYAEAGEVVAAARRQALSMAVLTQLYVARANFKESLRQFQTATQISDIDRRITDQLNAGASSSRVGELAVIQGELNAVQTALHKDMTYAELYNAYNQIFISAGADPLPLSTSGTDLHTLEQGLSSTQAAWARGDMGAE